ncbi:MAG TPA: class I mannose-6-phosphate isomerase [Allosphingosinicella sp.]
MAGAAETTGEIWFDPPPGGQPELLVKYLFTSELLSIQVHPDDEAALARGHRRGKDEAWLVLEAQPGATIGLGLKRDVSPDELRRAAVDGSIAELVDWKPVASGDFIYSPAGTIHAIGAGLSLIEVQQNVDLTYRLYDYGRPRELHLDEAIAVARPEPWRSIYRPREIAPGRRLMATGGRFTVERWHSETGLSIDSGSTDIILIPLAGSGRADTAKLEPGTVATAAGITQLDPDGPLDLLVAYDGPVRLNLVRRQDHSRVRRLLNSGNARFDSVDWR